ncbi:hypothetical protein D9M71_547330 [compost metagenome]
MRELRNMLEQTVLLAQNPTIEPSQLNVCMSLVDEPAPQPVERHNHAYAAPPEPHYDDEELPHGESDRVRSMLDKTDWNVTKSARLLGLTRDMLRYRIEKLGLTRPDKRHW